MRISRMATIALGVVALGGCAWGVTGAASQIHDTSARLNGVVRNTNAEATEYWFEYGPTTAYNSETPHRTDTLFGPQSATSTSQNLQSLPENTPFHYRLCARGLDGAGICGADMTFSTTTNRDSVIGSGTVYTIPQLGFAIGAAINGSSAPDGAPPVNGDASLSPGTLYFRLADYGPLTCMRVVGSRAAVGFVFDASIYGGEGSFPRVIFIEDNGPSGDRIQFGTLAAPYTSCPDPASATFPPFVVGGSIQVPPVLTSGDFVVEDDIVD
jgi:hypothetical protein